MSTYGYARGNAGDSRRSLQVQEAEILRAALAAGPASDFVGVFIDKAEANEPSDGKTLPGVAEMLNTLRRGDKLIVASLDRLGESWHDVQRVAAALFGCGVHLRVLNGSRGNPLDIPPEVGEIVIEMFALRADTERVLRSERFTRLARWRKSNGRPAGRPPWGQRIVKQNGVKVLEWDREQLGYIAEIARRTPVEGVQAVAEDFWRRGIRDRRGLWGKRKTKADCPLQQANRALRKLHSGKNRTVDAYQRFHRAIRWFHRAAWSGLLPPPYDALAKSLPKPKTFRQTLRRQGWTRGGTARREEAREQARAARKARLAANKS